MLPTVLLLATTLAEAPPLTVSEIVARMLQADDARHAALAGYSGMRRYRIENKRFNKFGEMTVRMTCASTGAKTFEIVEESGSSFIRHRVIQKMIDAERQASEKSEHEQTRIIPRNYDFTFVTAEMRDGRPTYVLEVKPTTANKFLIRGRIWVDAEDFAITRVEGSPAKNPSFWTHDIRTVQEYRRVGRFWMPLMNRSHTEVRIFGATDVEIDYFDYVANERSHAPTEKALAQVQQ